jgi:hypothetical protein
MSDDNKAPARVRKTLGNQAALIKGLMAVGAVAGLGRVVVQGVNKANTEFRSLEDQNNSKTPEQIAIEKMIGQARAERDAGRALSEKDAYLLGKKLETDEAKEVANEAKEVAKRSENNRIKATAASVSAKDLVLDPVLGAAVGLALAASVIVLAKGTRRVTGKPPRGHKTMISLNQSEYLDKIEVNDVGSEMIIRTHSGSTSKAFRVCSALQNLDGISTKYEGPMDCGSKPRQVRVKLSGWHPKTGWQKGDATPQDVIERLQSCHSITNAEAEAIFPPLDKVLQEAWGTSLQVETAHAR